MCGRMEGVADPRILIPPRTKSRRAQAAAAVPSDALAPSAGPSKEELTSVLDRVKPENGLDQRGSLVGRDADFSWFRFVIPAGKVMRDDLPTGQHDFEPNDVMTRNAVLEAARAAGMPTAA